MAGLGKTKAAYASKGGEAKRKPAPSRHSGGTSGHLSIPGYKTKTPVSRTPYSPSEPSTPVQQSIRSEGTSRRQAARTQRITAQRRQRKATERKVASVLHQIAAKHQNAFKPASKVAHDYSVPASKDPKVLAANREGAAGFAKEQRQLALKVKQVPVAAHIRNVPIKQPQLKGTPQQRKAVRQRLQQAKVAVQHSRPKLIGDLGPEQRQFIQGVAKQTHLSPRAIAAQARAEEGNASQTEAEQSHNFLNMGPGLSYPTLQAGVKATAANYNNTSSPNYAGVRAARGKGAAAQVAAIGASPWGTDSALIQSTLGQVGLKPGNPKAAANYQAVVKEAKELGMKVAPNGTVNPGPAPKKLVNRTIVAEKAMKEVEGTPYIWGGGHASPTSSPTGGGLDCSGAVGYVLNKIGALKGSLTSSQMGSVLKPGPGALTVFYNPEHTFLRLINRKGEPEYWGTSVGDAGAGGLTRHPAPSKSYLAEYSVGHVPGMGKKQALQLGASPGSLTGTSPESFPGMTFSPSGTTAKITPGSGATKPGKPGFSKRPIKLTLTQEYNQRKRALRQAGVPLARSSAAEAPKGKVLAELESRYGRAAV